MGALSSIAVTARRAIRYRKYPNALSSPAYAESFNARWTKVFDRVGVSLPPPRFYGALAVDLNRLLDHEIPEMGILELDDALIYGKYGWLFSRQGHFLSDHSWFGMHIEDMRDVPRFLPKGNRLSGVCLSLASEWAVGGYGHFITDSLPRLELFRLAGFDLSAVDHVVCPRPTAGNAKRLFDQLDIPLEKVIWQGESGDRRAEKLLAPTFPGTRRNYPKWVADYLRDSFAKSPTQTGRRLYVSRHGYSRNPVNFREVENLLQSRGFEIYDPTANLDAHLDFSQAEIVIGPSGSGLTGLTFCQPGTKVVELISTDHAFPYYYTLSNAAGLDYGCLVCKSLKERPDNAWGPSGSDFYIDLAELEHALGIVTRECLGYRT